MAVTEPRSERSLGELFGELTGDVKHLVQQEMRLAKVEVREKLSSAAKDAALMFAGASVLYAGFLALLLGLVGLVAHATELPWWEAGLIVGVLCLAGGGALLGAGLNALRRQDFKPEQTVTTLKEDAKWLKDQVRTS